MESRGLPSSRVQLTPAMLARWAVGRPLDLRDLLPDGLRVIGRERAEVDPLEERGCLAELPLEYRRSRQTQLTLRRVVRLLLLGGPVAGEHGDDLLDPRQGVDRAPAGERRGDTGAEDERRHDDHGRGHGPQPTLAPLAGVPRTGPGRARTRQGARGGHGGRTRLGTGPAPQGPPRLLATPDRTVRPQGCRGLVVDAVDVPQVDDQARALVVRRIRRRP